ncbi:hypothetical protein DFH09DRAFT_1309789 [Mycena vulgaris]|nr:hypothetical protein DFH09DRAFT_1309789 [Mycena vulgaris]
MHVTFFFNSGVEKQFKDVERFMISSPKVATCDLQPEMSVQAVAGKVAGIVVERKEYDFVMCNFAPPDMLSFFSRTYVRAASILRGKLDTFADRVVGVGSAHLVRLFRLSKFRGK